MNNRFPPGYVPMTHHENGGPTDYHSSKSTKEGQRSDRPSKAPKNGDKQRRNRKRG